jgi:hypothetical protein
MSIRNYGAAALVALAAALSACGGGGDGGSTPAAPTDSRNGTYEVFAADGKQYTANVNFNTNVATFGTGSDVATLSLAARSAAMRQYDVSGSASGDGLIPLPDAMIGKVKIGAAGASTVFVAARSFATSLAEAAGTYNMLGRDLPSGSPQDSRILPAEITAGGMLNTCNTATIYTVATCPTLTTYTLTISGSQFQGTGTAGTITFKVAKIGTDRVYMRASPEGAGFRYTLGLLNTPAYASGTFDVYGTETSYDASYSTDGSTTFSITGKLPPATPFTITGTPGPVVNGPTSLKIATTATDGNFFSIRAGNLSVTLAARGNPTHPAFMLIGATR